MGRREEALRIVRQMAKTNKVVISESVLEELAQVKHSVRHIS